LEIKLSKAKKQNIEALKSDKSILATSVSGSSSKIGVKNEVAWGK
jgi:hypothetical protein